MRAGLAVKQDGLIISEEEQGKVVGGRKGMERNAMVAIFTGIGEAG